MPRTDPGGVGGPDVVVDAGTLPEPGTHYKQPTYDPNLA